MKNPTCAYCLEEILTKEGSTVGMFMNKTSGETKLYCLCRICATEFRNVDTEKQKLIGTLIERNLNIDGVSLDPTKPMFSREEENAG